MFHPPSGEEGIWFSNPATAYKVTSIGVSGTRLWNRIIVFGKKIRNLRRRKIVEAVCQIT